MYDCSIWTHTGNGWKTETNKIFLLAEKYTKSIWEEEEREGGKREEERIGKGFLAYVVHMHVQQREPRIII